MINQFPPIFEQIRQELHDGGFIIKEENLTKPWGAYFLIDENQTKDFLKKYFPTISENEFQPGLKLSPKILVVAPHMRLSWQYHHRRQELWRVLDKPVEVVLNETDELVEGKTYRKNDIIRIKLGERHRLVGLDNWGVVAEIWTHTDPANPSNEDDIVRVQDDFSR